MAAPVWSVTLPERLADTCALAASEHRHSKTASMKLSLNFTGSS